MYKIETHLHTNLVSHCGRLSPEEIVKVYREAGYSGLAITDHFNSRTCECLGLDYKNIPDLYKHMTAGYEAVKEEADKYNIKVYLGAEFRFNSRGNDYLVYGFEPEFLNDPELFKMSFYDFTKLVKEKGFLLIQAHPFRPVCTPVAPCYIDGYEVLNTAPGHTVRNREAMALAEKYGVLKLSGSDCHDYDDVGRGGILADYVPSDTAEYIKLIRSGNYKLLGEEYIDITYEKK